MSRLPVHGLDQLRRLVRGAASIAIVAVGMNLMTSEGGTTADQQGPRAESEARVGHLLQRRQHFMGTWLDVTIRAENKERAIAATEAAFAAVAETDRRLSTWRRDSELAEVNRWISRGPVPLSLALARDLGDAMRWYRATDGAFSPGLGSLISAWDLRGRGQVPTRTELRNAVLASRITEPLLVDNGLTRQPHGLTIEEGGFGKGAALRQALTEARSLGALCTIIDFGGQTVVGGDCGPTMIGVSHPRRRHSEVMVLEVDNESVATSGQSQRAVVIDGKRYGHILDPRDGLPVEDWGAVTVVAADPLDADCGATALYVMGPESGPQWAAERPEIEAIFAENTETGLRLQATAGLKGRLSASKDHVIEWVGTNESTDMEAMGRPHTLK